MSLTVSRVSRIRVRVSAIVRCQLSLQLLITIGRYSADALQYITLQSICSGLSKKTSRFTTANDEDILVFEDMLAKMWQTRQHHGTSCGNKRSATVTDWRSSAGDDLLPAYH